VVVVNTNKDGSATAKPANAAAEVLGETKSASAKKGSMMKETEEMYNNMIRSAVKSGDISKAMKLAAEATNAGSATANATLNSALQSRK
jgi:pentatricopeptide repeat protein